MVHKLPPNPTWDDYKKDYEQWLVSVLRETRDRFQKALFEDEARMRILEKEVERKKKHIELIEAELAKR